MRENGNLDYGEQNLNIIAGCSTSKKVDESTEKYENLKCNNSSETQPTNKKYFCTFQSNINKSL